MLKNKNKKWCGYETITTTKMIVGWIECFAFDNSQFQKHYWQQIWLPWFYLTRWWILKWKILNFEWKNYLKSKLTTVEQKRIWFPAIIVSLLFVFHPVKYRKKTLQTHTHIYTGIIWKQQNYIWIINSHAIKWFTIAYNNNQLKN